jgi:2-methylcitrate dehydratase PrpD
MSIIEQMIGNIMETRFEDIPKEVIERAKDEVSDTIGCALGGALDIGSPMIVDLVKEWGGTGESTILGHGVKAPSHNVAWATAVMARSFDFGMVETFVDGVTLACHISETMVPAGMAIAEQKGMSGKELLTAVVLGEDITSRIMAAQISRGGWDMTGTLNTFGATAVAGKLWGLDARQWLNAFGIALNYMGGTRQNLFDRTHCFKLGQGLAAQRGILSVRLADKGFNSVKDPLCGESGYFELYGPDYDPEILTKDLGKKYWISIAIKPWPHCRGTHGATESTLEIARKNHIDASNIEEVTVIANENAGPALHMPFTFGDFPHVRAIFSLQYTVSNALLRGYPKPEHYTEESIRDPKIAEMMKKVKVTTPDTPNEVKEAATVIVKMKDGSEFREHVNRPLGNELEHPLSREAKREKFRVNANFTKLVKMENAEKALGMIEKLEDVKDIREIVKLLVA